MFYKEKKCFYEEMARAANRIEVNLTQEKKDFINDANHKQLQCWKNSALAGKNENEKKQQILVPLRVFLTRKDVIKNDTTTNVNELIFYLKNNYLPYEEEQGAFIGDISSREDQSFEEISDRLKTFAKSMKENENFSLKNKKQQQQEFLDATRIC